MGSSFNIRVPSESVIWELFSKTRVVTTGEEVRSVIVRSNEINSEHFKEVFVANVI